MANLSLLILIAISAVLLVASDASSGIGAGDQFGWMMSSAKPGAACKGSIAECMTDGDEFEMDTESNRRILATSNYISYGSLQGNTVPCSQRGASYYNCQSGGQANPYQRGCSTITRCQR